MKELEEEEVKILKSQLLKPQHELTIKFWQGGLDVRHFALLVEYLALEQVVRQHFESTSSSLQLPPAGRNSHNPAIQLNLL